MTKVNTNTKEFRLKMVEHVLSFQVDEETKEGKRDALALNANAAYYNQPFNAWNAGKVLAEAGEFLVYHHEIEKFMKDELGLTDDKYKNEDKNVDHRRNLYIGLCGKAVRDAVENTNKLFDQAKLENMN